MPTFFKIMHFFARGNPLVAALVSPTKKPQQQKALLWLLN